MAARIARTPCIVDFAGCLFLNGPGAPLDKLRFSCAGKIQVRHFTATATVKTFDWPQKCVAKKSTIPRTSLSNVAVKQIVTLKRNPQYLTPAQMESLKASIQRDGFCAPILVRPLRNQRYEVISGNHRFMAAVELGFQEIPCVIAELSDRAAKRLAVNLNTIHGEPNAELLAPFLAEMESAALAEIHIEDGMKKELMEFDKHLAQMLSELEPPAKVDRDSPTHSNATCKCPTCGSTHIAK